MGPQEHMAVIDCALSLRRLADPHTSENFVFQYAPILSLPIIGIWTNNMAEEEVKALTEQIGDLDGR